MKKAFFFVIFSITIAFLLPISNAAEIKPIKQAVQTKINNFKNLPTANVFRELQQEDFYYDEVVFDSAVWAAFQNREKQTVEYVTNFLKRPRYENDGEWIQANSNFMVAKRILRSFTNESIGHLRKIYNAADTTTKGNIIEVLGTVPDTGDKVVEKLLIDALYDQSVYEEEYPDSSGWPLRICDAAYNQLVLRLKTKNVIRVIGAAHSVETRDHYIMLLKDQL